MPLQVPAAVNDGANVARTIRYLVDDPITAELNFTNRIDSELGDDLTGAWKSFESVWSIEKGLAEPLGIFRRRSRNVVLDGR